MEKKFTKQNVSDFIRDEIYRLENKYKFKRDFGSIQVEGKNQEVCIAFGKWAALSELHYDLFSDDKNFYGI